MKNYEMFSIRRHYFHFNYTQRLNSSSKISWIIDFAAWIAMQPFGDDYVCM